MHSIYLGNNYPNNNIEDIVIAIAKNTRVVDDPKEADFFLFPVFYEVMFEYDQQQLDLNNYTKSDIETLRSKFNDMVSMAVAANKKIIIFYYRDPTYKLNVQNAVIFRTSLLKSNRDKNEFALPAFIKDIASLRPASLTDIFLQKTEKPTVAFRGQAAPIKLPVTLGIKKAVNRIFDIFKISKQVPLYYNLGYMQRRDAVISCQGNKNIVADMSITTDKDISDPDSRKKFLNNLFGNQYNVCASGHGNYSFRLYETLSAGRIPVFINTDCVLPFEEFIDWKKHVVWVDDKDAYKADELILKFHHSVSPKEFLAIQQQNRALFEEYLTINGFFENLHRYLQLI